ncbi:MAG: 16S rRNA (guanine(966)-N(2))-methyltransferase RsmD [Gallionellaceae bacterium]|nr:16S rRNA (guanine(966)-N(2))-methyltransferase RsmD [Gallionellaceae bacterium]
MAHLRQRQGSKINKVRIIGGSHRRRLIEFPDAEGLRPTPDRVRETLFNWLGQTLDGRRCLDLFAGSGALGFEAASRGATEVVMVERNRAVHRALQENIKNLGFTNIALRSDDGLEFAKQVGKPFDVIFLDPPFQSDFLPKLLPLLVDKLTEDGVIYVESGTHFEPDEAWEVLRQARAGAVFYQLLQHKQT